MNSKHLANQIYSELLKRNKIAAQAFKGALYTFRDEENPDRFSQAANSLRHVTSLLIRDFELSEKNEEIEELKIEFLSKLEEKGLSDSVELKLNPKGIMKKKIESLFIEDTEILPDPAKKKALFILRKLGDIHEEITGISHYGKNITEEDFSLIFNQFLEILLYFLQPSPKVIEKLDELINKDAPTKNYINILKDLLNHPSHVQYFFINLKSQEWFDLLKENDYFLEPKRIELLFNLNVALWPQGFYLIKMARIIPKKIWELINTYENCANFRIYRQLFECVYELEIQYIIKLIPIMKNWIRIFISIPEMVIIKKIIKKLIDSNEIDPALNFFYILLDFKEPRIIIRNEGIQDKFFFLFSDFEDILHHIRNYDLENSSCKFIKLLCDKLAENRKMENIVNERIMKDRSDSWRQSIDSKENAWESRDIKNLLVNNIRDSLQIIFDQKRELFIQCVQILSNYEDWPIFKRTQMYFINFYPEILANDLIKFLTSETYFDDRRYWHELYKLLKNHFNMLKNENQKVYIDWIDRGLNLENFKEYLEQFDSLEEKQKRAERIQNKWMLRHMEPIQEFLPSHLKTKYEEIVQIMGEIEEPEYYIKHTGPSFISGSPLSEEDIIEMKENNLINFLIDWNSKKDEDSLPYSLDLFGSKLSNVISKSPEGYVGLLSKFKIYPMDFLPYIIEGFTNALNEDFSCEYEAVFSKIIDLFNYLLEKHKINPITNDIVIDIYKRIVDFIISSLDKDYFLNHIESIQAIENIVSNLLGFGTNELDTIKPNVIIIDRITYYMNTLIWKVRNILLQYNYYILKISESSEKYFIEFAKNNLEKLLKEDLESNNITRAWFAYHIYYLYPYNQEWVLDAISIIFPEEGEKREKWRIALEAYLSNYHLHIEIYQKMRVIYKKGLNKLQSEKFSKSSKETLVKHLVLAYFKDLEDLDGDSLFKILFKKENTEYFDHAVWFINRLYMDWKEGKKDKINIVKIINIWKCRIEQIEQNKDLLHRIEKELYWFASFFENSDKNTESLKLMRKVLEFTKGRLDVYNRGVTLKLFEYMKDNYSEVLECFLLLIQADFFIWIYGDIEIQLREFLDYGINDIEDENIPTSINKFVQELIKVGLHQFKDYYID